MADALAAPPNSRSEDARMMFRTQRKEFIEVCSQAAYGQRCWTIWLFQGGM